MMSSREKVILSLLIILLFLSAVALTWYFSSQKSQPKADTATTLQNSTSPNPTSANSTLNSTSQSPTNLIDNTVSLVLQPGYNLKTIPYILSPADGKVVLAGLGTRQVFYLDSAGKWISIFESGTLSPGQGIWINSERGEAYQLPVSAKAVSLTAPYTIALRKGWNAIGNPFNQEITWDPAVKTTKGTTTFQKAITAKILSVGFNSNPIGKEYVPKNPGDKLKPFEGILIESGGDNIDLIISPQ